MKTTREMKEAIEKMNSLFEKSERLMFDDEAASDKAYEEGYAIMNKLMDTIVKISKGMIDRQTANLMVAKHSDKLIALCDKF